MRADDAVRGADARDEAEGRVDDGFFELAPFGIVFQDAEGAITSANRAAERILGLSLAQLQRRTSVDPRWRAVHADGSPFCGETHPAMVALRTGERVESVAMGVHNPERGRARWLEVSSVPMFRGGASTPYCVCSTFLDVTARKQLDDAKDFLASAPWHAAGEDVFRSLARFLGERLEMDFVCIDRLAGDELSAETVAIWTDGRFDDNVSYALKDTPCGDVVGKSVCSFPRGVRHLFPDDAVLQELKAEGYLGVTLWGSNGQPIGLIALIARTPLDDSSLAERTLSLVALRAAAELEIRQAEAARRLSAERLEKAFGGSPIGMVLVAPDGRLLRVNQAFCAIVGWPEAELLGMDFQAITRPDDLAGDLALVGDVLAGRRSGYQVDKRYRRKDGGEVWTQLNVGLVRDAQGAPLHFVSHVQDISERRRRDRERAMTVEVLDILNRGEVADDGAGGILAVLQRGFDMEAAAIRLANGDDFPFAASRGFAASFVEAENSLLPVVRDGDSGRAADGRPLLDCTCGLVASGRTDPSNPLFTPGGSAWTNEAPTLLDLPPEQDPRHHPRNRCIRSGYRSLAIVPIRTASRILGVLQISDRRPGCLSLDGVAFLEGVASRIGFALDRQQTHARIEASLEHLRLAHEAGKTGSWEWNVKTNENVGSPELYRLYGLEPRTGPESFDTWLARLHPDDREAAVAQANDAVARGAQLDLEWRLVRPDGAVRWLLSRAHPTFDAAGTLTHYLGIAMDITARKEEEAERIGLQAQLQQAKKLEAIGRLAGGVAHDFNNMLGAILGYAEMALSEVAPGLPLHADLLEIRKAAQRSADLTRQLLTFARKQPVAPKALSLNDAIGGMFKMLQRLIGENIKLDWHPTDGLWLAEADPSLLDQILANLCVNARDAIADVGTVVIEAVNDELDEAYCDAHAGFAPGQYVRLSVRDDGAGIPPEAIEHVFEPFFTTKAVGQGTGLGLATAYGAVRQLGGFIHVSSALGAGATFTLHLRRHVGSPEERARGIEAAASTRGRETVLIVEDEGAILRVARRILETQGYVVLAAGSPSEALRVASDHPGPIDLLVSDLVMPGMNGLELSRRVLELRPGLKRLFMSGYAAEVLPNQAALATEAVAVLPKPFSRAELLGHVRAAIDAG